MACCRSPQARLLLHAGQFHARYDSSAHARYVRVSLPLPAAHFSTLQALQCNAVISAPEQTTSRSHTATSGMLPLLHATMYAFLSWLNSHISRVVSLMICFCNHSWSSRHKPCISATAVQTGTSKPGGIVNHCCSLLFMKCISLYYQHTRQHTRHLFGMFQAELDAGQSIAALRRFSDNLAKLPEVGWGMRL